jgi:hypothetical protein
MRPIDVLIVLIVSIGFTLFIWKVTRFRYSMNEKHLLMKCYFVGVIPISFKVSRDSITKAQKIPLTLSLFFRNPYRWFFYRKPSREVVLIIRKRDFAMNLVISPSHPDEFIAALSKKIAKDERTGLAN